MSSNSITLRQTAIMEINLTNVPNGDAFGAVIIDDSDSTLFPAVIEILKQSAKKYKALLWGGRVGRRTTGVVKLIMIDDDGTVTYGTPISLTVAESTEPYLVAPDEWVKDTLSTYWDTSFIDTPRIIYPYERKALDKQDLIKVIEIKEGKVETEVHGQGNYKTNRYPIEITCRSEGLESSKDDAKKLMAHTKELIETYWNQIYADGLDFVEFLPDDAQNMSVEMAGKFEWRWNFKIVGTLRGRAGTPEAPAPI